MTPEQTASLRHNILLQLEAASPAALTLRSLHAGLRSSGHITHLGDLHPHLHYLHAKGLLAEIHAPLAHALTFYELTPNGRDYVEQHLLPL